MSLWLRRITRELTLRLSVGQRSVRLTMSGVNFGVSGGSLKKPARQCAFHPSYRYVWQCVVVHIIMGCIG